MQVFGIIFVITTTLILLFKKEKNLYYEQALDNELSIMLTFKSLWEILKLAPVQKFLVIMFTSKIAFATSHIRLFKLIENGVSKVYIYPNRNHSHHSSHILLTHEKRQIGDTWLNECTISALANTDATFHRQTGKSESTTRHFHGHLSDQVCAFVVLVCSRFNSTHN